MLTRGSKTAAEKVVRDSDMGSPDRREPIPPVADMQDSPLFKFLCELSPIQPAKTVHHAQTYNELTFPQEHRVFASPRSASRRSSTSALKRCVSAQAEGRESLGWGTMSRSTVCGSPSPLNRRSDETPCSRRQSGEAEVKVEPPSGEEDEKKPPSPELSEKVSDVGERRRQSTTSSCVIASQESRCLPEGEDPRRMSMGCSSGHGLSYSPVPKGSPELDRETTAMAYFLAGNQELGRGNEEWSEDSSEVVVSRLPNEMVRRQEGEMLDAITPQSGLGTCSEDGQDAITSQNVGQQQGLLSNRGESSGQRGFRRRCLDFDASVARRKSLGSMGGRKGVGSRLKDCSASTAAADDSNAVGDVAPTSPDASSGKVQQGRMNDFANANDSSRAASESGTYTRGDSLGTMTRMQFTGGSFRKTADVPHAKGEAQTPTSQKSGAASAVVPAAGLRRSPRVRPTGIGLHLNSLTSAVPFKREYPSSGGADSSKGVLATVLGLQPMPCPSTKENPCGGSAAAGYGGVSQAFNPGTVGSLSEMDMNKLEGASVMNNRVSIPAPDFRCLNLESLSALEESLSLTPGASGLSHVVSPRGHKRCQEELMRAAQAEGDTMDDLLDSPQSSKRRRLSRRKSTVTTQSDKSGDGCKRCNCKKSKCLKLYCECFAAGVYCVGSCACRDCFNKPEYEETVINTRHQIESRNPLAFAPKIVQTAESSPGPGDEALDTPASARHKRGCNCKKSLCLKKYCECYQAGVGCSEGCRCEGCKNMYGRKEGPEVDDKEGEQLVNSGREETSQAEDPIELLNRMSGKSDRLRDSAKANLSPITPTFEHDGHGRPMLRLRSMGRNKRGGSGISEEHCGSPLADPASRPPMSPTRFSQTLQDGFHLVPYAQQGDSDFSMSAAGDSPMTTPTFARIDHASPRWEGLGDLCTLTPLPLAQLRPTPGSSCVTTVDRPGASPAFSSHMTESPYHAGSSTSVHQRVAPRQWSPHEDSSSRFRQPAPRSPLRFDTPRQSQQQLSDQCHSTTTPPTPSMPLHQPPLQLLSGRNLQSELESAKVVADDDGTPEFLKYADCSESFGSPSRSTVTKSHSPKQKRVTPPRYGGGRAYREPGGNIPQSSLARRFILQALPQPTPSYPNG